MRAMVSSETRIGDETGAVILGERVLTTVA
jgi:hypothetical protein